MRHKTKRRLFVFLLLGVLLIPCIGQDWDQLPDQPEELGHVKWMRSYALAKEKAMHENKLIFILFQEVPGCSTCKNYGNHLLTHPHIVEAIETYFAPLAIYNNKGGQDKATLMQFNEPSWNNPVVRIIDPHSEKDVVKRLNGRYDMQSLLNTLCDGILSLHQLIPSYLKLLLEEQSATSVETTHVSLYCFWSGEKAYGNLEGVLSTRAGFMNGTEVVKITYDKNKVSPKNLLTFGKQNQCADAIYTVDQREIRAAKEIGIPTRPPGAYRPDKEPKYYIFNSPYKYVPMTELQSLKVNSALAKGIVPNNHLSPRQIELLARVQSGKGPQHYCIDTDFTSSWKKYAAPKN